MSTQNKEVKSLITTKYPPKCLEESWSSNNFSNLLNNNILSRKISPSFLPEVVNSGMRITLLVNIMEIVSGIMGITFICLFTEEYNGLFISTAGSRCISNSALIACVALVLNGIVLLYSLIMDSRRIMLVHILFSIFVCIYIFSLACLKMRYTIDDIEGGMDTSIHRPNKGGLYLTTAGFVALGTLAVAVIHFFSSITVLTYYELKYMYNTHVQH